MAGGTGGVHVSPAPSCLGPWGPGPPAGTSPGEVPPRGSEVTAELPAASSWRSGWGQARGRAVLPIPQVFGLLLLPSSRWRPAGSVPPSPAASWGPILVLSAQVAAFLLAQRWWKHAVPSALISCSILVLRGQDPDGTRRDTSALGGSRGGCKHLQAAWLCCSRLPNLAGIQTASESTAGLLQEGRSPAHEAQTLRFRGSPCGCSSGRPQTAV